ncbi:MAG: hypothetical protein GY797_26645 [Deltaproteobacteria bacterium]|nr:hypothetical protein [Deltaproteobacteria bacterium]
MTTHNNPNKKSFYRSPIFWGLGIVLFACLLLPAMCWYLPLNPVSPPATQLGSVPTFDTILAKVNEDWRFLFVFKGQLLTTDIYGQNDQVLLEISDATGSKCSSLLGEGSLSPDSKYLVIKYDNDERTADTGDIIGRLMVFDLENGSVEKIPTPLEGFQLRWYSDILWLSPTVFIVPMQRWIWKDNHTEEIVRFLRYDLQSLNEPQVIEFETNGPIFVFKDSPSVLLFASEHSRIDEMIIRVLDVEGTREATQEESQYFLCYQDWQCRESNFAPNIKVERVIDENVVEGWGRYYNENWNRYYVYLNNNLVRVSDGEMGGPVWDSNLELFIWSESGVLNDFYMDAQGHYRTWHSGDYWGKIPRNLQVNNYQKQGITNCQ